MEETGRHWPGVDRPSSVRPLGDRDQLFEIGIEGLAVEQSGQVSRLAYSHACWLFSKHCMTTAAALSSARSGRFMAMHLEQPARFAQRADGKDDANLVALAGKGIGRRRGECLAKQRVAAKIEFVAARDIFPVGVAVVVEAPAEQREDEAAGGESNPVQQHRIGPERALHAERKTLPRFGGFCRRDNSSAQSSRQMRLVWSLVGIRIYRRLGQGMALLTSVAA